MVARSSSENFQRLVMLKAPFPNHVAARHYEGQDAAPGSQSAPPHHVALESSADHTQLVFNHHGAWPRALLKVLDPSSDIEERTFSGRELRSHGEKSMDLSWEMSMKDRHPCLG